MTNVEIVFILASLIAVVGSCVSFKYLIENIKNNTIVNGKVDENKAAREMTMFFIRQAIIEAVPIILIVYGFILAGTTPEEYLTNLSFLVIIISVLVGIFYVMNIRKSINVHDGKGLITTYMLITIALLISVPLVSFLGLLVI